MSGWLWSIKDVPMIQLAERELKENLTLEHMIGRRVEFQIEGEDRLSDLVEFLKVNPRFLCSAYYHTRDEGRTLDLIQICKIGTSHDEGMLGDEVRSERSELSVELLCEFSNLFHSADNFEVTPNSASASWEVI